MKVFKPLALMGIAVLFLGACSYNAGFNSTYLPPEGITTKINERVLIVMSEQEQEWVYSGNPTSFTGGATTLTIPLGNITKQIAIEVFSRHFRGTESATQLPDDSTYRIAVNPRVSHFDYAYNQLKNLGFAITPEIQLDLNVKMFDGLGKQVMEKTYSSGLRSGESYMVSGSPAEKINQTLHRALFELMEDAAVDAVAELNSWPTTLAK